MAENSMAKTGSRFSSTRDGGYKPSAPPNYRPPAPVKVPPPPARQGK